MYVQVTSKRPYLYLRDIQRKYVVAVVSGGGVERDSADVGRVTTKNSLSTEHEGTSKDTVRADDIWCIPTPCTCNVYLQCPPCRMPYAWSDFQAV